MSQQRPFVVGVTGGIGSGKTTVCREFQKLGAPMVDTDQVAREVVAPGTPGLAAVVDAFGPEVLMADGQLDRRRVRQLVFASPDLRLRLEAILHPLIRQATDAQVAAAGYPYCLVCIPLLVERGGGNRVDRVLVIDCPPEVQTARVMVRDELTAPEVAAIMRSQASREDRLAAAHDVLENSGDIANLRPQIAALHARYLQLADEVKP
jgi:dephospho-CoA kinase